MPKTALKKALFDKTAFSKSTCALLACFRKCLFRRTKCLQRHTSTMLFQDVCSSSCVSVRAHARTCMCVCVCMRARGGVCVCLHIYIYIYIYVCVCVSPTMESRQEKGVSATTKIMQITTNRLFAEPTKITITSNFRNYKLKKLCQPRQRIWSM